MSDQKKSHGPTGPTESFLWWPGSEREEKGREGRVHGCQGAALWVWLPGENQPLVTRMPHYNPNLQSDLNFLKRIFKEKVK